MCFSATASFVAGSALVVLGVATLRATRRKVELAFAAIPLLFGLQQLVEGLLWLSFRFDSPELNVAMTYLFSMFSHVLWPIFVPFAIGLLEPEPWCRKMIWEVPGGQAPGRPVPLQFTCRFPLTRPQTSGISRRTSTSSW